MTMIDLSHELYDGMPVYPGDPEVAVRTALSLADDGVAVTSLNLGSHSGTHLDAPSHTVVGGRTLAEVSLDELVGDALVINVSASVQAGQALGSSDLGLHALSEVPRTVAIATGWDRFFGDTAYAAHPFVTREAAEHLWGLGMRLLAVDTLSPDETPSLDFPVHDVVLGGDGLIVENLTGLTALRERVRLAFFPLRLGAVDGAPVRAVAL